MSIIITPINQSDVNEISFNVNNLGNQPTDYVKKINFNNTCNWVDDSIKRYTITDSYHLNWMKEANEIGRITKTFPKTFLEELNEFN
jgi:hypothetical protein